MRIPRYLGGLCFVLRVRQLTWLDFPLTGIIVKSNSTRRSSSALVLKKGVLVLECNARDSDLCEL